MTVMNHYLVRLPKDLELGDLGRAWYEQVETITTLEHIGDRYTAPTWHCDNPRHDLDWRTIIWEADKAQVRRLLGDRPDFTHESMSDLRDAEKMLRTKLDELPDDVATASYGRRSRPELSRNADLTPDLGPQRCVSGEALVPFVG